MIDINSMVYWKVEEKIKNWKRGWYLFLLIFLVSLIISIVIGEPKRYIQILNNFLDKKILNPEISIILKMLIFGILILIILLITGIFLVWLERKISAHIQSRLGPMRVGRWHGWAQTIADAIKLILKGDSITYSADKISHRLAPLIAFFPAFVCFLVIPVARDFVAYDFNLAVIYVLAISGISVIGILLGGWAQGNKYSLLGGLRGAAQLVSYEIPRSFSVIPIVMISGSMSLVDIIKFQKGSFLGFIPKWFIFYPVVGQIAFLIYLISTIAETNRTPFDIPEAESEIVAGFHTEYSGIKFAMFFLGEYTFVFIGSLFGAILFLGGPEPIFPFLNFIPSWIWLALKTYFLIFVFMWVRWTYPRMRVDQLMNFCWKFLLPWSVINIFITGILNFLFFIG